MTRFHQHTTGREIVQTLSEKIDGKIILITGPSHGTIGGQALLDLAAAKPAKVLLVGRSISKIQPAIDKFKQENTSTELIFIKADMDDLDSIRKAADDIKGQTDRIDIMFNNAGVMATPWKMTKQGHEWQFGINHLSHFVLTARLYPLIEAAGPGAVIVNTSSTGCNLSNIPFDDITWSNGAKYNPWRSYGASKTANALFTVGINTRYRGKGIRSYAIQPGMPNSHLQDDLPQEGPGSLQDGMDIYRETHDSEPVDVEGDMKTLEESTSTMFAAAFDSDLEQDSGKFLRNCNVFEVDKHVLDPAGAEKLWKMSEDLSGERF